MVFWRSFISVIFRNPASLCGCSWPMFFFFYTYFCSLSSYLVCLHSASTLRNMWRLLFFFFFFVTVNMMDERNACIYMTDAVGAIDHSGHELRTLEHPLPGERCHWMTGGVQIVVVISTANFAR